MIYAYSFCPHPNPSSPRWNKAAFELFRGMGPPRVQFEMTEVEFREFREQLSQCGIECCEIERSPWNEPESVP